MDLDHERLDVHDFTLYFRGSATESGRPCLSGLKDSCTGTGTLTGEN